MESESDSESTTRNKSTRKIVIDDEESPEKEIAGSLNGKEINGEPAISKCHDCQAFQANAQHAWSILGDYKQAIQQIKELKTDNEQLKRISEENRRYIATLRTKEDEFSKAIKRKNQEIDALNENIANIKDQYDRVLKAGTIAKKSNDELNILKVKYAQLEKERDGLKETLRERLEREAELKDKYKAAVRLLTEKYKKQQITIAQELARVEEPTRMDQPQPDRIEEQPEPTWMDGPEAYGLEEQLDPTMMDGPRPGRIEEQPESTMMPEPVRIEEPTEPESTRMDGPELGRIEEHPEPQPIRMDGPEPTMMDGPKPTRMDGPEPIKMDGPEPTRMDGQKPTMMDRPEPTRMDRLESCRIEEQPEPTGMDEYSDDRMEEDEDDLLLLLPPSRPTTPPQQPTEEQQQNGPKQTEQPREEEEQNRPKQPEQPRDEKERIAPKIQHKDVISIEKIFKSSFFMDMETMPLLEDIDHLQLEKQFSILEQPIEIELIPAQAPRLAIYQISKKYNVDKKKAALLYTQAMREEANKKKCGKRRRDSSEEDDDDTMSVATASSSGNFENSKEQMPWTPKIPVIPRNIQPSILSFEDHRRYVGIIVNQLKPMPTFRFEQNKIEIQALDKKLENERQLYEKTALQTARSFSAFSYMPDTHRLFTKLQKARIQFYVGDRAFQGALLTIPWSNESLGTAAPPLKFYSTNLLMSSALREITIPNIHNKFLLNTNSMHQLLTKKVEMKDKIFDDKLMQEYGLTKDVSVLMDASTLRHLLSSTWSLRFQNYACRLRVSKHVHTGVAKNLFTFSPPIIGSRVNKTAISQALAKWALKITLLKDKEPSDKSKFAKKSKSDECESLLDELGLGDIGKTETSQSKKRYAIIDFDDRNSEEAKYRVLIRTTPHGRETATSKHISMTGRAEFLPEVGAEKLTMEERVWNLVTGMLKGSEEHVNFRVIVPRYYAKPRGRNREATQVVQYDRSVASDFSRLGPEIRQLLATRVQRFCGLLDELPALDPGEYLIMPDPVNDLLQIVKEKRATDPESRCDDGEEDEAAEMDASTSKAQGTVYDSDWFNHMVDSKVISSPNEMDTYWNGVDPHYPLQWHIVHSQIPGALRPRPKRK